MEAKKVAVQVILSCYQRVDLVRESLFSIYEMTDLALALRTTRPKIPRSLVYTMSLTDALNAADVYLSG